MSVWHGLIFVRKGYYRKGVFPFTILIPPTYPSEPPSVTFPGLPFHPLIHPSTGSLTLHPSLSPWSPSSHLLLHLLSHLKKAFYHTHWWADASPPTPAAALYRQTRGEGMGGEFGRRVERSVRESVEGVWGEGGKEMRVRGAGGGVGGGVREVHEKVWERVQERWRAEEEGRVGGASSYLDWFLPGVAALGGEEDGGGGGGGSGVGGKVAVTAEEEREWMEEERRRRAEERKERLDRAVAASQAANAPDTAKEHREQQPAQEEEENTAGDEHERPAPVHVLDEGDGDDELLP